MARLTKTFIEALTPGSSDFFLWDDAVSGFGIRVFPSGSMTYVAQYRAAGRTRRIKIGYHGHLTVEQARREAKIILGNVARGQDPQEDRITKRQSLTVKELCENYLAAAEQGHVMGKGGRAKKQTTLANDMGRIARHVVPLLGNKLVKDISRADIAQFLRDVSLGKTAVTEKTGRLRGKTMVTGGAGAASRTLGMLGSIFSFAVQEGVIQFSPVIGVKRPADNQRTRRLTADEFGALGLALRTAEDDLESWQGIKAAWMLALTGCRRNEVIALKWAEVDAAGGCLRLADSKEGASVRPIGKAALAVLAGIERQPVSGYVFPAPMGNAEFRGMAGSWRRLMTRAGLEAVTPHTLRHSFASVAGDLGFTESTIGAMLGHAAGTVTSRYVHHLDAVLVAAADKVASEIHAMMTGQPAEK